METPASSSVEDPYFIQENGNSYQPESLGIDQFYSKLNEMQGVLRLLEQDQVSQSNLTNLATQKSNIKENQETNLFKTNQENYVFRTNMRSSPQYVDCQRENTFYRKRQTQPNDDRKEFSQSPNQKIEKRNRDKKEKNDSENFEDAADKRGEIMCPKCHEKVEPVVRRQRNRVTRGNMCSMLLFGCFPFCFLPYIMTGKQIVNLYCSKCSAYLGSYDFV